MGHLPQDQIDSHSQGRPAPLTSPRRPFFFSLWVNRVFSTRHRLAWSLSIFFLLFLVVSTAFVVRLQGWVTGNHAPDLMAVSRDLHTLTSGSLILSGLHSEEILKEESRLMSGNAGEWNDYFTEVIVGDSFPLRAWTDGLRASLERAGARLSTVKEPGGMKLEVRYRPGGAGKEIVIERLLVRRRPSPEVIASRDDTSRPRAALVMDDLGQNPAHFRRLADLGLPFTVSIRGTRCSGRWATRSTVSRWAATTCTR